MPRILKVARLGNPVLRKRARELKPEEIASSRIQSLIEDMVETMHEYSGVGLAAPQVHESIRLAIIEFSADNSRYPAMGDQPLSVFINPKLKIMDKKEQGYWEGCLSVPGIRGYVERPRKVQVEYLDEKGEARKLVAEGFLATVFQHEFDHLDGALFLDRVQDKARLAFIEEYQRYWMSDDGEDDLGE